MKQIVLFISGLLVISLHAVAQFNLPVYWTGGGGGGNTEICGTNVLTLTADPIATGLTYRWIAEPGWCPPGSQATILNTGSQVFYYGESVQIICQAIDSLNQVQGESWPIPVYNPDFNGGICDLFNSGSTISGCQGDSILLRCNEYLPWSGAIAVSTAGDTVLQWQKDGIDITGTVNELSYTATTTGLYRLKYSLSCGTSFSNSMQVNLNPAPVVTITGTTTFCQGNSGNLNAGAGYTSYLWNTGATTQTINISQAGIYTVTVIGPNGCTGSDSIVVTTNVLLTPIIFGDTTICQGQTTTLTTGPVPFYSYIWSNGVNSPTIIVGTAGTYTVTVSDGGGCTGTTSTTVTVNANPTPVITGNTVICQGSCTILNAGSGYSSYLWASLHITSTVNACIAGIYWVTVTDANGCSGTDSITVNVNPSPFPIITGDSTLCPGQSTVLNAGAGYTSYLWNNGNSTPMLTTSVTGTYTVTVTSAALCSGTDSITVIAAPPYATVLSTSGPLGICLGDSVQLTEPIPMSSYQWYKYNLPLTGATSSSIWVSAAGRYKCLSTDIQNCPAASNQLRVRIICFPPPPAGEKGMDVAANSNLIHVFPNPSTGIYYLELNGEADVILNVTVANIVGQVILDGEFVGNQSRIDISTFPNGVYVLHATDGKNSDYIRLVKSE